MASGVVAIAALALAGCGREDEAAPRPTAQCEAAVSHVGRILDGAAPGEKATGDAVVRLAVDACRREGLDADQAACILAVGSLADWYQLRDCPAIARRQPSWLVLPPAGATPPRR
jgi:hypothetical protein